MSNIETADAGITASTARSTNITVTNGFQSKATITLSHLSGSCGGVTQQIVWTDVAPGASGIHPKPYLDVMYNTGAGSSNDYWYCSAVVDGLTYVTEGTPACPTFQNNLETADASSYQVSVVTNDTFFMNLKSGNKTSPMTPVP